MHTQALAEICYIPVHIWNLPPRHQYLRNLANLINTKDFLLHATLPRGPAEDEVDIYKALALAGRVSELSNATTPEHSDLVLS